MACGTRSGVKRGFFCAKSRKSSEGVNSPGRRLTISNKFPFHPANQNLKIIISARYPYNTYSHPLMTSLYTRTDLPHSPPPTKP